VSAAAAIVPSLAWAALIAAAGAALVLGLLLHFAERLPHAEPNARSLHERPVCRVGGLSIWAGWLAAMGISAAALPGGTAAWIAWAAIAAVSLIDDWRGVAPLPRLALHVAAAALASVALPGVGGVVGVAVATLAIAWSANLYNFMDGSDGLAATMAACGFAALAAGAAIGGASPLAPLALAAAVLPLLVANAPPARLFMGDVGAVPLGFLGALVGIAGVGAGQWEAWFPLLVFLPFVGDASVTLAARLLRGERVWEAHRSHYYQRLNRLGAGHRGTLAFYGVLMAGTGSSAVFALLVHGPGWLVLGAWAAAIAALFAGIDYHCKVRHQNIQ
jgi:UDP-N-acetylmuramyl pentapeptide phosphotransferase/UDP-N-acetylglucosamine-1-phosphate transferase